MIYSFSFNGIKKDFIYLEDEGDQHSAFAPVTRNLLQISGLAGAHLDSTDTQIRVIKKKIFFESDSPFNAPKMEEEIASWLITEEAKELILDNEPDRIYYAVVDGGLDITELLTVRESEITFICPDPYKYGRERTEIGSNSTSIDVSGSVPSMPVVEVTLNQDVTYVAIGNGQDINMVGNITNVEDTVVDPETNIFTSNTNTLAGWTDPNTVDYGEIMGTLATDGSVYYASDYGVNTTSWHGPAKKTGFSEAVQDFRFDVGFRMYPTDVGQAGYMIYSLLDANNIPIATITSEKINGGSGVRLRVIAGRGTNGHAIIPYGYADYGNEFRGVVRLWRQGTLWTAQVFLLVNGSFASPITHRWTDTKNVATAKVTQVQVQIMQRATFPVVQQMIDDIDLHRLNGVFANQVPILGYQGDVVTFDHQNDNILLNGKPIIDKKAFIGKYFKLSPGQNTIISEPAKSVSNTKVRWKDSWR